MRRPISRESVERDLRNGEPVHRSWAPEAIAEMEAEGAIVVRADGYVSRPKWRQQTMRALISKFPHSTGELAKQLNCTDENVCAIARSMKAKKFMARGPDGRVQAVWRL